MRRLRLRWTAAVIASGIAGLAPLPALGEHLDWREMLRERNWVMVHLDSSRPDAVPRPLDQVKAITGSDRHTIYVANATDVHFSTPVVSRDGSMVAFSKSELRGNTVTEALYTMALAKPALSHLVTLARPVAPIRGSEGWIAAAWSHDNTKLAYLGRLATDPSGTPVPTPSVPAGSELIGHALPLRIIDVRSREMRLVGWFGWRVTRSGVSGQAIRSQAWAPDNRRLVYMNDVGELVMFDVVDGSQMLLGPGSDPTWSFDGQWIAARVAKGEVHDADYVIIAAAPPHTRTVLLSHRRSPMTPSHYLTGALSYFGPALWTPDGNFLIVSQAVGEREFPVAIKRADGTVHKIAWPQRRIASIGGRP